MHSFKETYVLPFKFQIANYSENYIKNNNFLYRFLKYFKRYLLIYLLGQKSLEVHSINTKHKNILWINISAPSLGDTIMDLSSRALLQDRRIDLFTLNKNASLYKDDIYISNVFCDKAEVNQHSYDLVIIDSYSSRSIRIKNDIAPKINFVSMFGFYNGPEVNRVLFSYHRMNQLMGYEKNLDEISKIAKPALSISSVDKEIIDNLRLPDKYIAIAIGGEWAHRTYNHWSNVIDRILFSDKKLNIVLVGSENGEDSARKISNFFSEFNIINHVSKFSFNQTAEIIKRANILLCCDGGLMHAANAVETPIIPLLARLDKNMQLTQSIKCKVLFDKLDVNNINYKTVCKAYFEYNALH